MQNCNMYNPHTYKVKMNGLITKCLDCCGRTEDDFCTFTGIGIKKNIENDTISEHFPLEVMKNGCEYCDSGKPLQTDGGVYAEQCDDGVNTYISVGDSPSQIHERGQIRAKHCIMCGAEL